MKTNCTHCGSDSFDLLISQIALDRAKAELTAANARADEFASISRELAETSHVSEYSLIPRFIKAQARLEELNKITL